MRNISIEYKQFLTEKILQYIPNQFIQVNGRLNIRCPFCGDSKRSLTKKRGWIYLDHDCSFFCFNCGTAMSGIKFLKLLSGTDYEAIHREYVDLFLKSGLDSSLSSIAWTPNDNDEPNMFNLKNAISSSMKNPLTERAIAYLASRKVLEAPFLKDPLYSIVSKNSSKEYILIPWRVNGIDAYYQVNDFLKLKSMKYLFPKGKKKLLYGLDNIDPSYKKIFAFEGVYDSLFVKNGIATGTKSITDYQMRLIKERWPYHEVVVSFDNDLPGFSSTKKLIETGKAFKFFVWFDGKTKEKDINELVLAKGNLNMFTDAKKLDSMVYDALQMKLWMISNGKWQDERKVKKSALLKNNSNPFASLLM